MLNVATMNWKWWLVVVILILVGYHMTAPQLSNYPPTCDIKDFPLIEQPDGLTCGPTSVAMTLRYFGIEATVDDVAQIAKTRWYKNGDIEIGGTTPEYIAVAFEAYGVASKIERASNLDRLREHVSKGPVVALVRSGRLTWHYVVVIGYDQSHFILADPGGGERVSLLSGNFLAAWKFTHDMDGEDESKACFACGGTGHWAKWLGPFGVCDVCGGTGRLPDWMWLLVEMGEAQGCTIIIPQVRR